MRPWESTGRDPLNLETRRRIYDTVESTPGAHVRRLERELSMPLGQLTYHLGKLERTGHLVARKDGVFKRYFVQGQVGREGKTVLSALRHEAPRRILITLLTEASATSSALAKRLDLAPSTIAFHVARLTESGVLHRGEDGLRIVDPDLAHELLHEHASSFDDPSVERYVRLRPRSPGAQIERPASYVPSNPVPEP